MTYVQFQNTNPYSTRVIKTKSPLLPITNSKKIAKSSKKNFKIMIRRTSICSAQLYTQPQACVPKIKPQAPACPDSNLGRANKKRIKKKGLQSEIII